jgi:hypothetical protein
MRTPHHRIATGFRPTVAHGWFADRNPERRLLACEREAVRMSGTRPSTRPTRLPGAPTKTLARLGGPLSQRPMSLDAESGRSGLMASAEQRAWKPMTQTERLHLQSDAEVPSLRTPAGSFRACSSTVPTVSRKRSSFRSCGPEPRRGCRGNYKGPRRVRPTRGRRRDAAGVAVPRLGEEAAPQAREEALVPRRGGSLRRGRLGARAVAGGGSAGGGAETAIEFAERVG